MAKIRRLPFCLALIVALAYPSHAIDPDHYRQLVKQFGERARAKDWPGAHAALIEIGRELPAPTPRFLLLNATVEMHLGHKTEAIQWLEKYAATGLTFDLAQEGNMKPLLEEEGGRKVAAQMKERGRPVEKAEFVCTLSQADIMPEDIAYAPASNSKTGGSRPAPSFIVSSIQHRTLYRVSLPKAGGKECAVEELPLAGENKHWPTLAVSADTRRKTLWVTTSAMPGFSGFPKEDEGKALLLEVDAASGRVLRRFDPETKDPAVLGDMCVTADGTVYVTDSIGGGVYRLRGDLETAKLEKIAGGLFSPQTPVLARDGKRLFVADYTMGIAVVDLGTGKVSYLPHPEDVAVVALDGLYLSGDSLIGIQNGTDPNRIMRLRLNAAQTEIIGAEVMEQATERMGDPTHAVLADGWLYVSANVGWNKVDDDTGKLKPGEKFTPPVLLRFRAQK
jgi:sugar lactone lactonase YvrE